MLDATFFRKMNFNYFRLQLNEFVRKKRNDDNCFPKPSNERIFDEIKNNNTELNEFNDDNLLICCSTVSKFFPENKW